MWPTFILQRVFSYLELKIVQFYLFGLAEIYCDHLGEGKGLPTTYKTGLVAIPNHPQIATNPKVDEYYIKLWSDHSTHIPISIDYQFQLQFAAWSVTLYTRSNSLRPNVRCLQ